MADNDSRAGQRYETGPILEYLHRLHAAHDEGLGAAFDTPARAGIPAIQLGQGEARFLQFITRLSGARKAIEVGTLAGYSAIRIARGMPDDGHLWTLENTAEHARLAEENLRLAGVSERVDVLLGDALESLSSLEKRGPFDLVFIDADKERYPEYGAWAARHLRPGGLLVADNVYFFGRLLDDSMGARAMRAFHEQAALDFDTCCLPTPDGLLLGTRRGS